MSFRLVVSIDIEDVESLDEAYSHLYDFMKCSPKNIDWESTDEGYDEDGQELDPQDIQLARMKKFQEEDDK